MSVSGELLIGEMRRMRWWLLSRDEARDRAREHVERAGLPWTEPVRVMRRSLGGWGVMTNSQSRGGNVFLSIARGGRVRGGERLTPR